MDEKESRKLKITLILAANIKDPLIKKGPFMPLSLPILASVAPEHDYTLIDMLWDPDKIDFNTDSEIIGISLRQSAESTAFELADEFQKRGKTVILGGAQASIQPHRAKEHAQSVVIGEAEELWPIALKDYINGDLKDFYVCSPKAFDARGMTLYQSKELPDLQDLPVPARHLYNRKYAFDLTFAARGCPIACDFCLVSDLYGRKLRLKQIDDVLSDIKQFKKFYYLLDDTVFGRPNCYDYYLELYDKIARLPKKKLWTGQANIDAAATEKGRSVIKAAARAGLVYAAIGLESINSTTLKSSGAYAKMGLKNAENELEKMKEHIAFIQSQGILISGWFAIGYETDTVQTYYDTLEFCKETNILPVFTPIRALPGSRLWERLEQAGRIQDLDNQISNINHPKLTNSEIVQAMYDTAMSGYEKSVNKQRLKFYYKKFRQSEKNFNDVIYKMIFTYITQKRMRTIVTEENTYLTSRIGSQ